MSNNIKGSIILLLTALIWGTAFVAQSAAMDNIGPLLFITVRFFLSGLLLVPVITVINRSRINSGAESPQYQRDVMALSVRGGLKCGICLAAGAGFQQYGILTTSAGKAGFLTALYIVLVPLIGIFTGRRVSRKVWLSVAIAIVGFYLLSINEGFTIELGDILCTLCAVGFAFQITFVDRYLARGANPLVLSSTQFFTVSAIFLFPMLLIEGFNTNLIIAAGFSIFYTGIISGGLAYTMQIIGQAYTDPTLATLLMSLESVFAAISGWLILHQALSPREMAGCALVFAAVLLAQL